jgi:hypothetical protein
VSAGERAQLPRGYRADFLATARSLAASIDCPQSLPAAGQGRQNEDHGKHNRKHKGRDQGKGSEGED